MERVFIVAEAGVNHNGSVDLAQRLIEAAAAAGADAVKFQSFHAEQLVAATAAKAAYQVARTGDRESQLEMLRRLELDDEAHRVLAETARNHAIEFMSTPFDAGSLDLLLQLNVRRLKIASGELTNAPLLLRAARSGKPMILSTGMSTLAEISDALAVLAFGYTDAGAPTRQAFARAQAEPAARAAVREKVTLLHCTTEYPAPYDQVNLRAMDTLRQEFGVPVGLSDHTEGIAVAIAAAARGAVMIEKHLTLDRALPGPDHCASIEPHELAALVRSVRQVEQALGDPAKEVTASERGNREVARRSLVAAAAIGAGDTFTESNLAIKRPGTGLSPLMYWEVLGKRAKRAYQPDEVIEL